MSERDSKMQVVLLVEDEPLIRMIAVEFIEACGYTVIEARNADEAIVIMEARPDIRFVFTDVNMPGSMDGLQLAHYARNRWPPVKIIVTSGKARLLAKDLPSGGAFLSKPYSPADLGIALERLADQ